MDIGSILLILALFVLVGLYVGRPLFDRKTTSIMTSQEDHEISGLMAERDQILNALQELEFDYTLEKIPSEDYPEQRAALLQKGAAVLRRLDELGHKQETLDAESRLEAVIAARRTTGQSPRVAHPDDALEAQIAARRREREAKSAGFCTNCGRALQKTDKFCPKCGAAVA